MWQKRCRCLNCGPGVAKVSKLGVQWFSRFSKYSKNHYYVCIKKNSNECKARLITLNTNTDPTQRYHIGDITLRSTSESTKRNITEVVGEYPNEILHRLSSTDVMSQ